MKLIPSLGTPAWASGFKLVTSVCDLCQRSCTTRHQSAHNIGIRMHEGWYCGARCFTAAAERVMSQLLMSEGEPVNRLERMPLGLLLVRRGLVTMEQLRDVTQHQKSQKAHKDSSRDTAAHLVACGIVSEKQVAAARASQWGCPLSVVPSHGVRCGIVLPPAIVQFYEAIPLHYGTTANQLLVGFVNHIEYGLLYAIEHLFGCKTQASFITPSDFGIQCQAQDATVPTDPVIFAESQSTAVMAGALCKAALDLEAHEAVIARCRGFLWARVKRETEAEGLLFKTAF